MQHSNQVNKSAMERLRNLAPKQIIESKTPEKLTTLQESKPVAEKGMVDALRMVTEKMSHSADKKEHKNEMPETEKKEHKEEKKEDKKMNLKEYFKERLMEEIAESFMTDAQRATPEGQAMQIRHAGKIKDLMSKHNEDPDRFKKSPNAAQRLRDMGTRVGMKTKVNPVDLGFEGGPKPQIMHGVINPKPVSSKFGSENKISIQDTNEVDRRDAHQMLRDDRKERLQDIRSKQAAAAKEKERKSWEV